MHFLLEFTPISSSHSSPIRFYPAPCIEIRDSRDVNFDLFWVVFKYERNGFYVFESLSAQKNHPKVVSNLIVQFRLGKWWEFSQCHKTSLSNP